MRRCLRHRTLWLLYEGEGTETQQAHLATCGACAGRYQSLVHDLEMLRYGLQEEPHPHAIRQRSVAFPRRWLAAAATVAVALAVMWGGVWMQRPSPPVLPEETYAEDIVSFFEELSAALFSPIDADAAELVELMDELDDLEGTPEGA